MNQGAEFEHQLARRFQKLIQDYEAKLRYELDDLRERVQAIAEESESELFADATRQVSQHMSEQIQEKVQDLHESYRSSKRWQAEFSRQLQSLCATVTQRDFLQKLLDVSSIISPRNLLFLVKQGCIQGWDARGYAGLLDQHNIRSFAHPLEEDPFFRRVAGTREVVSISTRDLNDNEGFLAYACFDSPCTLLACPLRLFGSLTAVLLLDEESLNASRVDAHFALFHLAIIATSWLENLAMRKGLGLEAAPAQIMLPSLVQEIDSLVLGAPEWTEEPAGVAEEPAEPETDWASLSSVEEDTGVEAAEADDMTVEEEEVIEEEFAAPPEFVEEEEVSADESYVPESVEEMSFDYDEEELVEEPVDIHEQTTPDFDVAEVEPAETMTEEAAEDEGVHEIRLDEIDEISVDEAAAEELEEEMTDFSEEEIALDEEEFDWSEREDVAASAEALEEIELEPGEFDAPAIEEDVAIEEEELADEEIPALEEDEVLLLEEEPELAESEAVDLEKAPAETQEMAHYTEEEEIVLEERALDELIEEENEASAGEETFGAEPHRFAPPVEAEEEREEEEEEAGPLWDTEEEEKLHNDARRFARLLVSEIKLYNEEAVAEGRISKDLYHRLKRDIDRSREMYQKRVSDVVARKFDYFHEEMVRILGEGDAAKLGGNYPGPQVKSGE